MTAGFSNLEGVELFWPSRSGPRRRRAYGEAWRGDTESVQTDPMSALLHVAAGVLSITKNSGKKASRWRDEARIVQQLFAEQSSQGRYGKIHPWISYYLISRHSRRFV